VSEVTIYTCDRCGKSGEDVELVEILMSQYGDAEGMGDFCDSCLAELREWLAQPYMPAALWQFNEPAAREALADGCPAWLDEGEEGAPIVGVWVKRDASWCVFSRGGPVLRHADDFARFRVIPAPAVGSDAP
jgi:hypothetical protein